MAMTLPLPNLGDWVAKNRTLTYALALSIFAHGIILAIRFTLPDIAKKLGSEPLEIILVNAKSDQRPLNAQAYAQTNLDGGGNTEDNRRASTPLPAMRYETEGDDIEKAQQRVQALEEQQQVLLARLRQARNVRQATASEGRPDSNAQQNGKDAEESAKAMSRLEGEIAKEIQEYNQRPKKKFLSPRTMAYAPAMYLEAWRSKVERIGNANYPAEARGRTYGSVVLTVELRKDGSLYSVEVSRSSGQPVLDQAAVRIVQLGQPYGAVPAAALEGNDILSFSRTLNFTREAVSTEQ